MDLLRIKCTKVHLDSFRFGIFIVRCLRSDKNSILVCIVFPVNKVTHIMQLTTRFAILFMCSVQNSSFVS